MSNKSAVIWLMIVAVFCAMFGQFLIAGMGIGYAVALAFRSKE